MALSADGSILVNVDAEIQDLVPHYLAHRGRDLKAATAALGRGDFGAIRGIGHNLHGSGYSFGFDELTAIGCELEGAASAGDRAAVARQLGRLAEYLSRVEVAAPVRPVPSDAAEPASVAAGGTGESASGSAEILLVDDQELNAAIVRRYLVHAGYAVRYSASGDAALAVLECRPPPALIVLDVVMEGTDGLEVCRRIKSNPATSGIPVIVVSAMDGRDDRVQAWAAGADEVLSKPVRRGELVDRVRSLAGTKKPAGDGLLRAVSPSSEGEGG